jgi:hypothetical protein
VPYIFINADQDFSSNWSTQQLTELIPKAKNVEIAGSAYTIWLARALELQHQLQRAVEYIHGCRYSTLVRPLAALTTLSFSLMQHKRGYVALNRERET